MTRKLKILDILLICSLIKNMLLLKNKLAQSLCICFFPFMLGCAALLSSNSILKGSCNYNSDHFLYQGHCVEFYGSLYSSDDVEQSCIEDNAFFNLGECDSALTSSYACIVDQEETRERYIVLNNTFDIVTAQEYCTDCNQLDIRESTSDICGLIQEINNF